MPDDLGLATGEAATRTRRIQRAFTGLILVFAALVHGPWLTAPFGLGAVNAGAYFGPFAQAFHQFGFAALRGAPIVVSVLDDPRNGLVYLHHPPGTAWVLAVLGTAEWSLRLPTILAQLVAAIVLLHWLTPRLGAVRAGLAGLALVVLPVLVFHAQVSYEPLVLAAGLAAQRAMDRITTNDRRVRHKVTLVTLLAVGPWLDWAFAFFAAALAIPILARVRPWPRALGWIAGVGCGSLLAAMPIFWWKRWAQDGPLIHAPPAIPLPEMIATTVGQRPELSAFARGAWTALDQGFTPGLVGLAALGAWSLARRQPVLAASLLFPGLANVLVFAEHARTHVFYFAYLAPALVAAAAALPLPRWAGWRRIAPAIVLVVGSLAVARSTSLQQHGSRPYFKDLGRIIDQASAEFEGQRIVRAWRVHVTIPYAYPYYYRSPIVFLSPDPATLERERRLDDAVGVRCIWLDVALLPSGAPASYTVSSALADYLADFPSVPLPQLETVLSNPLDGSRVHVQRANLVTIR